MSPAGVRAHGLTLVMMGLFLVSMTGQIVSGFHVFNDVHAQRRDPPLDLGAYLTSGHFIEATAENWESEFLQMACYVVLTIVLYQRGSSESKEIGERAAVDRDPRLFRNKRGTPWPVRRGGWVLVLRVSSFRWPRWCC